jgi:hypothetical protein
MHIIFASFISKEINNYKKNFRKYEKYSIDSPDIMFDQ